MKKCKECLVEKPMDDFYSHPLTKDRRLPKCKDCIKAGRSTENELIMARIRDKERYQSQKIKHKARQWTYMSSQKNKHLIPIICPIT